MPSVTAGSIISAGLRRADMADSPTGFIQHPTSGGGEAFDMLNAAIGELWDTLLEVDPSYSSNLSPFPTVSGTAVYTLPAGFYRVTGVMMTQQAVSGTPPFYGATGWSRLARANKNDVERFQNKGRPVAYDLTDASGGSAPGITLYPTPDGVYNCVLQYEQEPTLIAADATSLYIPGPWREFLELHFAIQCLEKEGTDTGQFTARLAGITQRIRNAAYRKDSSQPITPVDVQGSTFYDGDLPPFARWTR